MPTTILDAALALADTRVAGRPRGDDDDEVERVVRRIVYVLGRRRWRGRVPSTSFF